MQTIITPMLIPSLVMQLIPIGEARNLCWGPDIDNRGAEGAEIVTPNASRGEGYGEGVSPPQPTRGSGGAS